MRKILLALFMASSWECGFIYAQTVPEEGINYQAVVNDAAGKVLPNAALNIKIALGSENTNIEPYFTEIHQVTTDFLGQFSIVIGGGKQQKGAISQIPWGKEQIWFEVAVLGDKFSEYRVKDRTRLLSVPYALHAATATRLSQDTASEKNQSIYWTTTGNSSTRPPTHFMGTRDNKDVVIKTDSQTLLTFKPFGQTHLQGRVIGNDLSPANYPLTIDGSTQGIFIKVRGSRNNSNNFVTFADDFGVWGRIEGQTREELEQTWQYKLKELLSDLRYFSLLSLAVSKAVEAKGLTAGGFTAAAGVAAFAIAAVLGEEIDQTKGEFDTFATNSGLDQGVSYASGAGDYAEWLERSPAEPDLHYGEIVGIKGGMVSLNTVDADQVMVISLRPAVIGNAPQPDEKNRFEKVAFMGQVPVKVAGAVAIGDFIVASGNNDGFGVAIHPKDMKPGDFARSVGVAWQTAPDQPINFVNTAVGINTNDLSQKVEELNQRLENILAFLEGKISTLNGQQSSPVGQVTTQPQSTFRKLLSDEEFDQFVDQNAASFKALYSNVKVELQKSNFNFSAHPKLMEFMDNPVPFIKEARRNPAFVTQWSMVDQQVKSTKTTE